MFLRKSGSLLFLLLGCFLLFLLSACGTSTSSTAAGKPLALNAGNAPSSSESSSPVSSSSEPAASSSPTASVSVTTSCPATGTGRAAVLPSLKLGKHQNVVYTSNQVDSKDQPLSGILKRYDVLTKSTTNILTLAHQNIVYAQVSADGQWVLFESVGSTQQNSANKVQLIRMDGRYLQTLYCAAKVGLYEIQWSANQKNIAFVTNDNVTETVDVLSTTTGTVKTELTLPANNAAIVRTWLDTMHIYLTNTQRDQPPNIIYLLDISKGSNQHLSDLTTVFNGSFNDFDSSYDGRSLYISSCSCGQGGDVGPGTITVQPATSGKAQTLYSTSTYAITSVRAVTPTTLLFTIANFTALGSTDTSHNGLWKISSDGSGLTRLTTDAQGQGSNPNAYSQFPWSNVSRDGSLYAVQVSGKGQSLLIGSLNGGTPTAIASSNGSGAFLDTVGWTTM